MFKSDHNQAQIVHSLRSIGATVKITASVGHGFPDIVVGWKGINYLFEIKNKKTHGKPNELQRMFFEQWKGSAFVVSSIEEILPIIGVKI